MVLSTAKNISYGFMSVTNDKVFITRSSDIGQFAKPFLFKA